MRHRCLPNTLKTKQPVALLQQVPQLENNMDKVFLGGTCNGSTWRDEIIPLLTMDYFNPVVEDWTPECMEEEVRQRAECAYCLYVITPKMTGAFSIAEVVDDSNKVPHKTVLCVLGEDGGDTFTPHQVKSLDQVMAMVEENGAATCRSLPMAANILTLFGGLDAG